MLLKPAGTGTVAGSGDVLFDDVSFGESGTLEVLGGGYTRQVRAGNETNDGEVVAEDALVLEGRMISVAFAVGYLSSENEPTETRFDLLGAEAGS